MRSCCFISIPLIVALLIALTILSFNQLSIAEQGLNYNTIFQTVSPTPYAAGRYFLGIGHKFITFPHIYQTISFAGGDRLPSRTSDGLEVELELSFQFWLIHDRLSELYNKFGTNYRRIFVLLARDILTTVATQSTAHDFFVAPSEIRDTMEHVLNEAFSRDAFAMVSFFQLQSVSLPVEFEEAIRLTEVEKQDIMTAKAQQGQADIQMETKLIQVRREAQIVVAAAEGEAQRIMLDNSATLSAFNTTQRLQINSYAKMEDAFHNDGGDEDEQRNALMEYMKLRAIHHHEGPVVAGLSS